MSGAVEWCKTKVTRANNEVEGLKSTVGALEVRNRQLQGFCAQHEASIEALREEVRKVQGELADKEQELLMLRRDTNRGTQVQARLKAENDAWRFEKLRLKSENYQMNQEIVLLRTKLEQKQTQFKWSKNYDDAVAQLGQVKSIVETLQGELRESQEQLQVAESRFAGRGLAKQHSTSDGSDTGGKSRLRDNEVLMAQTKQELKSVGSPLAEARKKAEEYKAVSEEAELSKKVKLLEAEAGATRGEILKKLQNCLRELEAAKSQVESYEKSEAAGTSESDLRKRPRTSIDSGVDPSLSVSEFNPSASATSSPIKKCRTSSPNKKCRIM